MDKSAGAGMVVVRELAKEFGSVRAVDGVSLVFEQGVNALLGPNGAGKTTFLRLLATSEQPTSGTIDVFGLDTASARRKVRRLIGYAPQEGGLYSSWRVDVYLDYIALLREVSDQRARRQAVDRALDVADLRNERRRRISKLSGGMRRRLLIAQAILADPKVLLLDEPFAGLDPEQRVRMRTLVSELGRSRIVVVSTHQTEDVSYFCDTVTVLAEGVAAFVGTPEKLTAMAEGHVWVGPPSDPSLLSSALGSGSSRHVGIPPEGRAIEPATIEDGYLVVLGTHAPSTAEADLR